MSATAPPPAVDIDELSKSYRDGAGVRMILRRLQLTVAAGEFVCVAGRSGGGKTTLLNIVGGLDRDFDGRVEVSGARLDTLSDDELSSYRNREVGLVFQEARLVPALSCRDNLLLPSLFTRGSARRPAPLLRTRAAELLDAVGLRDRERAPAGELSGGEKQRLSLARALLNRPRLLLCDEITGNLDRQTARGMIELVLQVRDEFSVTVLAAAHDRSFTAAADRVLHLDEGRLIPWAGGD